MIKAAKRMCVCTSVAITTFLPITGTSRLPIGMRYPLLLAGEVHDPAERQHHVQHDHDHDQNPDDRREGPLEGAVFRPSVQPRQGEQEHDKDGRHHDGSEGDQSVTWKEHEHLLVEEEEPLGAWDVGDGGRVRRLGERRRGGVGEHHARDEDRGRDVAVLEDLAGEERYGLVRALVDVLRGDYLFLNRFGLASRRSVHLYTSLLAAWPHDTSNASLPAVNTLTPRPCQPGRDGPRRAPPRPRAPRSPRTPRRAAARAALPAYPSIRTRCRTRRGA